MATMQIGFQHTEFGGGDDFPRASDAIKAKYAAAHLDRDWRNVVMVGAARVEWAGQHDDRLRVTREDGTTSYHGTRRGVPVRGVGPARPPVGEGMATNEGNRVLEKTVHSLLAAQRGWTASLADGTEANVTFDGECVLLHNYGEDGEPVYHGRLRLVPEED